jgi:hypothetical protein
LWQCHALCKTFRIHAQHLHLDHHAEPRGGVAPDASDATHIEP